MNLSRVERIVATLLLLAPLLLAGIARAEPPGPGPRGHRGPPPLLRVLEEHADRLDLDERTQAEITELATASRVQSRATREQIRGVQDELRELLGQMQPDEAAIMERVDALGELRTAAHKQRLRSMLQIRALLTPEQRDELVRIREEKRPRHERGPRGPRPGREDDFGGPPPPPPER